MRHHLWLAASYVLLAGGLAYKTFEVFDVATPRLDEIITSDQRVAGGRRSVVLLFSLADCATRIEELRQFNSLVRGGRSSVQGYVMEDGLSIAEIRRRLDGSGIQFPLTRVPARMARVLKAMDVRRGPAALVVGADRRVEAVWSVDPSTATQIAAGVAGFDDDALETPRGTPVKARLSDSARSAYSKN